MEVPYRLRPSGKNQYPLLPDGGHSTLNETGQLVEKHSNRYFPFDSRSTPAEGTTKNPSGIGISFFGNADSALGFLVVDFTETAFGETVFPVAVLETVAFGTVIPEADTEVVDKGLVGAVEVGTETVGEPWETDPDSHATSSGNGGKKSMRSAEYPENDVVKVRATVGSPEERVRKAAVDRFLIRNSEDVDESARMAVFGNVVPENAKRNTGQRISAREKYPVSVATRLA